MTDMAEFNATVRDYCGWHHKIVRREGDHHVYVHIPEDWGWPFVDKFEKALCAVCPAEFVPVVSLALDEDAPVPSCRDIEERKAKRLRMRQAFAESADVAVISSRDVPDWKPLSARYPGIALDLPTWPNNWCDAAPTPTITDVEVDTLLRVDRLLDVLRTCTAILALGQQPDEMRRLNREVAVPLWLSPENVPGWAKQPRFGVPTDCVGENWERYKRQVAWALEQAQEHGAPLILMQMIRLPGKRGTAWLKPLRHPEDTRDGLTTISVQVFEGPLERDLGLPVEHDPL